LRGFYSVGEYILDDRTISENIRSLREQKELTQAVVAQVLGLSQSAYSKRESGQQSFSAFEVAAIARVTKADIRSIFRGAG
jgi:transcriptional regulator with XRE-family HTH domain